MPGKRDAWPSDDELRARVRAAAGPACVAMLARQEEARKRRRLASSPGGGSGAAGPSAYSPAVVQWFNDLRHGDAPAAEMPTPATQQRPPTGGWLTARVGDGMEVDDAPKTPRSPSSQVGLPATAARCLPRTRTLVGVLPSPTRAAWQDAVVGKPSTPVRMSATPPASKVFVLSLCCVLFCDPHAQKC